MLGHSIVSQHFMELEGSIPNSQELQIWRLAANILNKQSRTGNKGWSSSLGVGLTTLHRKKKPVTNNLHKPRTTKMYEGVNTYSTFLDLTTRWPQSL
jgi:hypothetical protein